MWDTIGELWIQSCIAITFPYVILCLLIPVARKLLVIYECPTDRVTALLEMSIFCVRAGFEIQTASYAFEHILQSLFDKLFLCIQCILRHITWQLQVMCGRSEYQMTAMLYETSFEWFRVALVIQLESYGLRHTSVVLWYDNVCVYRKPVYTSIFGTQLHLTTKFMYLLTAY